MVVDHSQNIYLNTVEVLWWGWCVMRADRGGGDGVGVVIREVCRGGDGVGRAPTVK